MNTHPKFYGSATSARCVFDTLMICNHSLTCVKASPLGSGLFLYTADWDVTSVLSISKACCGGCGYAATRSCGPVGCALTSPTLSEVPITVREARGRILCGRTAGRTRRTTTSSMGEWLPVQCQWFANVPPQLYHGLWHPRHLTQVVRSASGGTSRRRRQCYFFEFFGIVHKIETPAIHRQIFVQAIRRISW